MRRRGARPWWLVLVLVGALVLLGWASGRSRAQAPDERTASEATSGAVAQAAAEDDERDDGGDERGDERGVGANAGDASSAAAAAERTDDRTDDEADDPDAQAAFEAAVDARVAELVDAAVAEAVDEAVAAALADADEGEADAAAADALDVDAAADAEEPLVEQALLEEIAALRAISQTREDAYLSRDWNQSAAPVEVQVTTDVREALRADESLSEQTRTNVYVTTLNGVVVVEGEVPSERERAAVADMIEGMLDDRYSVTNALVVRDRDFD